MASTPPTITLPSGCVLDGNLISLTPWFPQIDNAAYTAANAGKVRTVFEFLGIPYAQPPVGLNRFKPTDLMPEPPTSPWDATNFKAVPWHQPLPSQEAVIGRASTKKPFVNQFNFEAAFGIDYNEDCLFLNVWTPDLKPAAPLPVMFWVHGGGGVRNTSTQPQVQGGRLCLKGVVVITLDYRLSCMGHFYDDSFAGEPQQKGSFAFNDIINALLWVKRNVASFGGDPNNISIYGESFGGATVAVLMLTKYLSTTGLFHKAGIISGGGTGVFNPVTGVTKSAQATAARFKDLLNPNGPSYDGSGRTVQQVRDQDGDAVALRTAVAPLVLQNFDGFRPSNPFFSINHGNHPELREFPYFDGTLVAYNQSILGFQAGAQRDVPLMIGGMTKEATVFGLGNATTRTIFNNTDTFGITSPSQLATLKQYYDAYGARTINDGVIANGQAWLYSNSANFGWDDVGNTVDLKGFPPDTYILSLDGSDPTHKVNLSASSSVDNTNVRARIRSYNNSAFGDDVVGDVVFLMAARQMARGHAQNKTSPVYYFNFGYTSSGNNSTDTNLTQGIAGHGASLPYLFGTIDWAVSLGTANATKIRMEDIKFMDAFQNSWANFAANGDPNISYKPGYDFDLFATGVAPMAIPTWDPFVVADDNAMMFTNPSFVANAAMKTGFRQSIFEYYRTQGGFL